jgi:hypothetical protein
MRGAGLIALLTVAVPSPAQAAYYEVFTSSLSTAGTINAGDGYCSLTEAIESINGGATLTNCTDLSPGSSGHIQLIEAPGKPYASFHYSVNAVTIRRSMRIQPSEEGFTAYIDGTGTQAFRINSGIEVNFYGLDLKHVGTGSGRLIYNSGTLNLANVFVRNGNVTTEPNGFGGGIYNEKTLWLSSSQVLNNSAKRGGGIYNKGGTGTITIVGGVISQNSATMAGGGIYNINSVGGASPPTDITAFSTTISNNTAKAGGGVFNKGIIELRDSSLTFNTASGTGSNETCGGGVSCDGAGGGACSVAASDTTYSRIGIEGASAVTDNVASGRGGGFYSAGQLNLSTINISRNKANRGGAIFASHSGTNHYCSVSSPADFTYSVINNNMLSAGGLYSILDWDAVPAGSTAKCVMAQNRVSASGNATPRCATGSANPACPQ